MKKKIMDAKANRCATVVVIVLSVAIMHVMKKYGKEHKE